MNKSVIEERGVYALKELRKCYTVDFAPEMGVLSAENVVFLEWIAILSISYVGPTPTPPTPDTWRALS